MHVKHAVHNRYKKNSHEFRVVIRRRLIYIWRVCEVRITPRYT